MIALETRLDSIDIPGRLDDLYDLLENAQSDVTFWGDRVVRVPELAGSVFLDDIAHRVDIACEGRMTSDDLTPHERFTGIEIVQRLRNFYQITDNLIQHSNFLTKFLNWIREFFFIPRAPRFCIEETTEIHFRAYSRRRYVRRCCSELYQDLPEPIIATDEAILRDLARGNDYPLKKVEVLL